MDQMNSTPNTSYKFDHFDDDVSKESGDFAMDTR